MLDEIGAWSLSRPWGGGVPAGAGRREGREGRGIAEALSVEARPVPQQPVGHRESFFVVTAAAPTSVTLRPAMARVFTQS